MPLLYLDPTDLDSSNITFDNLLYISCKSTCNFEPLIFYPCIFDNDYNKIKKNTFIETELSNNFTSEIAIFTYNRKGLAMNTPITCYNRLRIYELREHSSGTHDLKPQAINHLDSIFPIINMSPRFPTNSIRSYSINDEYFLDEIAVNGCSGVVQTGIVDDGATVILYAIKKIKFSSDTPESASLPTLTEWKETEQSALQFLSSALSTPIVTQKIKIGSNEFTAFVISPSISYSFGEASTNDITFTFFEKSEYLSIVSDIKAHFINSNDKVFLTFKNKSADLKDNSTPKITYYTLDVMATGTIFDGVSLVWKREEYNTGKKMYVVYEVLNLNADIIGLNAPARIDKIKAEELFWICEISDKARLSSRIDTKQLLSSPAKFKFKNNENWIKAEIAELLTLFSMRNELLNKKETGSRSDSQESTYKYPDFNNTYVNGYENNDLYKRLVKRFTENPGVILDFSGLTPTQINKKVKALVDTVFLIFPNCSTVQTGKDIHFDGHQTVKSEYGRFEFLGNLLMIDSDFENDITFSDTKQDWNENDFMDLEVAIFNLYSEIVLEYFIEKCSNYYDIFGGTDTAEFIYIATGNSTSTKGAFNFATARRVRPNRIAISLFPYEFKRVPKNEGSVKYKLSSEPEFLRSIEISEGKCYQFKIFAYGFDSEDYSYLRLKYDNSVYYLRANETSPILNGIDQISLGTTPIIGDYFEKYPLTGIYIEPTIKGEKDSEKSEVVKWDDGTEYDKSNQIFKFAVGTRPGMKLEITAYSANKEDEIFVLGTLLESSCIFSAKVIPFSLDDQFGVDEFWINNGGWNDLTESEQENLDSFINFLIGDKFYSENLNATGDFFKSHANLEMYGNGRGILSDTMEPAPKNPTKKKQRVNRDMAQRQDNPGTYPGGNKNYADWNLLRFCKMSLSLTLNEVSEKELDILINSFSDPISSGQGKPKKKSTDKNRLADLDISNPISPTRISALNNLLKNSNGVKVLVENDVLSALRCFGFMEYFVDLLRKRIQDRPEIKDIETNGWKNIATSVYNSFRYLLENSSIDLNSYIQVDGNKVTGTGKRLYYNKSKDPNGNYGFEEYKNWLK